jgi:hypothetical protein
MDTDHGISSSSSLPSLSFSLRKLPQVAMPSQRKRDNGLIAVSPAISPTSSSLKSSSQHRSPVRKISKTQQARLNAIVGRNDFLSPEMFSHELSDPEFQIMKNRVNKSVSNSISKFLLIPLGEQHRYFELTKEAGKHKASIGIPERLPDAIGDDDLDLSDDGAVNSKFCLVVNVGHLK